MDMATCAKCGKTRELCRSLRVDGLQQPRICKECLLKRMKTGDETVNDLYWALQMTQLNDVESYAIVAKQLDGEEGVSDVQVS